MRDDLIRRSDVYKAVDDWLAGRVPNLNIKDILSADRPQGEWIDRSDGGRILHPWWESYECSQCKEQGSGAWNFCPHCGARMKGADDDL